MSNPIRVIVVDDSALMRSMITRLLEQDPAIRVVGTAQDGREAIKIVEDLRPDLVTMDVRMPVMDGLETTEYLMAYCPTPILVITASLQKHDIDITFKMLGAGALEVIEKPTPKSPEDLERVGRELIRRVKVLARVKVVTHLRGRRKGNNGADPSKGLGQQNSGAMKEARTNTIPAAGKEGTIRGQESKVLKGASPSEGTRRANVSKGKELISPPPRTTASAKSPHQTFPLIVIGASTGGPRVVHQILAGLPCELPAAVLIVQHIAEGFTIGMIEWLTGIGTLPVSLAQEGSALLPGQVLVAPDRRDLLITRDRTVHLSAGQLLIQRPAIDITMQAAAEVFGPRTIGVLLTGMGRDGAYGMLTIQRAHGYTIAQDKASCTIFGMPYAAIQLGAVDEVLPPHEIASRLAELVIYSDRFSNKWLGDHNSVL